MRAACRGRCGLRTPSPTGAISAEAHRVYPVVVRLASPTSLPDARIQTRTELSSNTPTTRLPSGLTRRKSIPYRVACVVVRGFQLGTLAKSEHRPGFGDDEPAIGGKAGGADRSPVNHRFSGQRPGMGVQDACRLVRME